jgi:hypothetical protein
MFSNKYCEGVTVLGIDLVNAEVGKMRDDQIVDDDIQLHDVLPYTCRKRYES